jgi:hypothetical protein
MGILVKSCGKDPSMKQELDAPRGVFSLESQLPCHPDFSYILLGLGKELLVNIRSDCNVVGQRDGLMPTLYAGRNSQTVTSHVSTSRLVHVSRPGRARWPSASQKSASLEQPG